MGQANFEFKVRQLFSNEGDCRGDPEFTVLYGLTGLTQSTGEAASNQNPIYNSAFNYGCQPYAQSRGTIVVYVQVREEDNAFCGGDDIVWNGRLTTTYTAFVSGEVQTEANLGNGERLAISHTWSDWGTRAPTAAPTRAPTTPAPTRSPASTYPTAAPIAGTGAVCDADADCSSGSCKPTFVGGPGAGSYCCAFSTPECIHCAPFTGACERCLEHFDVNEAGGCAPIAPSRSPTRAPTPIPSAAPTAGPSRLPTLLPSSIPTYAPISPTSVPSRSPSASPTTEAEAGGASSSADAESAASATGIIVGGAVGILAVVVVAVVLYYRSRPDPMLDGRSDQEHAATSNPIYGDASFGAGDGGGGPAYEGLEGLRYGSLGSTPDAGHAYNVLDKAGDVMYSVPMCGVPDGGGGVATKSDSPATPDYALASAAPDHYAVASNLDTGC